MTTYSISIQGIEIPIANSKEIGITLQMQDFRDLQKARQRTISSTIEIHGDANINALFYGIWDIKASGNAFIPIEFDYLKRIECILLENGTFYLAGFAIMKGCKYVNGLIVYELLFSTNEVNKIADLESVSLNQLTYFNRYNHVLNAANIIDTWNGYNYINNVRTNKPSDGGYIYSVGFFGSLTKISATNTETQPTNKFNSNKLLPFFHVKELFIQAFKHVGITANVNIDSDYFGSLLISGSFEQLKKQLDGVTVKKEAKLTYDAITQPYTINTVGTGVFVGQTLDLSAFSYTEDYDQDGNVSNGIYVATRNGRLTIKTTISTSITVAGSVLQGGISVKVLQNGANVASQNIYNGTLQIGTNEINATLEQIIDVNIGDVIRLEIISGFSGVNSQNFSISGTVTPVIEYKCEYTSYLSGETVKMSDWLPNMKASDFVKGIMRLFNLYITELDDDEITFTTRNSFYYGYETAINIDEYVDYSQPIDVKSMIIEQDIRSLSLKYTQPNDYVNKYLKDTANVEWGANKITINESICTKDETITLPFALIVPCEIEAYNIVYPCVYDYKNNKYEPIAFAPMLCYYNGLIQRSISIIDINNNNYSTTTNQYYPLFTPNYKDAQKHMSLYFGVPSRIMYQTLASALETTNTVFNLYHLQDIENFTNPNSKLVKVFVSTEAFKSLYNKLNMLRRRITYDGAVFVINKIIGYNDNLPSVEVELIKDIEPRRTPTFPPPISIGGNIDYAPTSTLKVASFGSGRVVDNEIAADVNKRLLYIGNNPVVIGRKEYYGYISQSGTSDPTLTEIKSSFTPEIQRVSAGNYKFDGLYMVEILYSSEDQSGIKIYTSGSNTYIDTNTDDVLSNNLIYIAKI